MRQTHGVLCLTMLPGMHFQGVKERAGFTKWLCRELTSACKSEAPPLPKDRKKGPEFKTADPQDLELNKMMANMKARPDTEAPRQHARRLRASFGLFNC